nr:extracellular solute-binding protein [Cohnella algarum]
MPDIVRADPNKYGRQLIEGDLVIPMDDMLAELGKDITANVPTLVDYSRKNWSEGQNKLYFLPPQVQPQPSDVVKPLTIGPTLRWDWYKEIGAPEINNTDDLLNVIEQIVKNHPTTEDGKKVYGVSMWQDWGLWPYIVPFVFQTSQTAVTTDLMQKAAGADDFINILTDESSNYWLAMDYYNKANRRGLLDPDALTMKNNDYMAKATAGQLVSGPADWAMGDFNSQYAKDGKGFMVVPAGKFAWNGGVNPIGWGDKSYSISKSSKHPVKAMQFLNYLYSYEGARTMYSGIEGTHWDMVDGKPQLKEETFALKTAGGQQWESTGIALDRNLIALGSAVVDPATNTPVDLFSTSEAIMKSLNALQKDFSEYYGVSQPGDVFAKYIEEGKLIDSNTALKGKTQEQILQEATVVAPVLTEDLLKLESQLKELAARSAAKIILSKTDEEFAKNKQEALDAFKKAGADQITEFYNAAYDQALKDAGLQ